MQDIKKIQKNPELFKQLVSQKNIKLDIDHLLDQYNKRVQLLSQIEKIRQSRNDNVNTIKNTKGKPPKELIIKGKNIKEQLSSLGTSFNKINERFNKLMWYVPQIVSKDTPVGIDESGNVEVRKWDPEKKPFLKVTSTNWLKDHIELGTSLNILDLRKGVRTSGFRGYYLKNEGALMHMGLMMYGMKLMKEKGFENIVPPTMVKEESLYGSGHFPFDKESVYTVDTMGHENDRSSKKEKKYLIGTSEPSLLNYYRDETINKEDLPIKMAGFSQCYRGEIGSYGKDIKGIYRIHEFMKIEQVIISDGNYEESEKRHQEILSYAEEFVQALELPYRILQICTGDMGAGKYKMFDIETWMPSRDSYGETHSASNLGDWQARRLNIKIKDKDGNKYYAHSLNNTVVASPRIMIAIWENYQNKDGSITVPKVLRPYVGVDIIKRH